MAASRTILIAGAGIGGLTAAIGLARAGHRVEIVEQAPALSDIGAGLQISPNAARVLIGLGLGDRLADSATIPDAVSVRSGRTDREIASMPLGQAMAFRFGAPYWVLHRGDLQAALADAVADEPDVSLNLGSKLTDFATHSNGLTALVGRRGQTDEVPARALIGADGLWSATRVRLKPRISLPDFRGRTAWRATLPAGDVPDIWRGTLIRLWLGPKAHLVLYPLRGGALTNLVAIVQDGWREKGWSAAGNAFELLQHFPARGWSAKVRDLLDLPKSWVKWALFDSDRSFTGEGPVTLIGDAAHPLLPFLAQGAGMAIEDAAALTQALSDKNADISTALRRFEAGRRARIDRVREAARLNGRIYHMSGPAALARNAGMRMLGGKALLQRYDWLYDWRPD